MSDETNLSDLLSLNLHNFEDEVRTIVDKATKELSMEKTLKVCGAHHKTWRKCDVMSNTYFFIGCRSCL